MSTTDRIETIGELLKAIYKYESHLIDIILEIVKDRIIKDRIIKDYFSKHKIKVGYCCTHDQGFIFENNSGEHLYDHKFMTCHSTKDLGCHYEFPCNFDENFIKDKVSLPTHFNFELSWYVSTFYDINTSKIIDTPLAIKLFYDKHKLEEEEEEEEELDK